MRRQASCYCSQAAGKSSEFITRETAVALYQWSARHMIDDFIAIINYTVSHNYGNPWFLLYSF